MSFELCFPSPARAATAADTWALVTKTIVVHPGTDVSTWKDASRSLVTNGPMTMTAVGDGTYEAIIGLTRGQTYNYLFFANAPFPAPGGLTAFNEYYDIIPALGYIKASTNGNTTTDTTSAKYASVAFDARRQLTVPTTLNPGDTLWVFNNFGETPGVVAGLTAVAEGDTQIRVSWTGTYGFWGQGGESFKAADVLAGGRYQIFKAVNNESGPFVLIATIGGDQFSYLDTNLAPADTFYYVIRAQDAYQSAGASDTFPRLTAETTLPAAWAKTASLIRTFFIVRDADWNTIESRDGVAYFSYADDSPYGEKIPVRMVRVIRRREN